MLARYLPARSHTESANNPTDLVECLEGQRTVQLASVTLQRLTNDQVEKDRRGY
ncbi:MAG: hypothetical protein H3C34_08320 [Caldilineaceae bacterium]|nr:hypothetical protein [Caldilineaceae bacterium]